MIRAIGRREGDATEGGQRCEGGRRGRAGGREESARGREGGRRGPEGRRRAPEGVREERAPHTESERRVRGSCG
jgi:hypothetical protein